MEITQVISWMAIVLATGAFALILLNPRYKSILTISIVIINSVLSSIPAVLSLSGLPQTGAFHLAHIAGPLLLSVDSLSAWFILIINFTSITGILYGDGYLKSYSHLQTNRDLHWVFYILFHASMLWVCMVENGLGFLVAWELMSLSSLMLVIFEFQNKKTLKAGINYMVQMHLSIAFLSLGFILLFLQAGTFDFSGLSLLERNKNSIWIFALLFAGFAIKAGFIPFHTWLPHAHPAGPSHVSGVMSGVIVKLGIYGIFRIIINLRHEWLLFGEIILGLSIITAVYGIANAVVKKDFKRMLAYCTIENIGIIGIGIGIGLIGMGNGNMTMQILGFSGALLHTLNHSLFKSLLFFSAGNIYQQTHTRNMERLGGLIKKMPKTALFFLIGSVAIGGIPPFNGFVSEFVIYSGIFKGLLDSQGILQAVMLISTIAGLAIVGGMSLLTFTKTFGVVFLGNPREQLSHEPHESSFIMLFPQYLIVAVMLSIAVFPQFYFQHACDIVRTSFSIDGPSAQVLQNTALNISGIGKVSLIFIVLLLAILGIRRVLTRKRTSYELDTWGCGYVAPIPKAQYSGRSYIRSFGMLFNFLVKEEKSGSKIPKEKLYPGKFNIVIWYTDILEKYFVVPSAKRLTFILNYFQFIQNGQIQSYVLYGLFFVILVFLGSMMNFIY